MKIKLWVGDKEDIFEFDVNGWTDEAIKDFIVGYYEDYVLLNAESGYEILED